MPKWIVLGSCTLLLLLIGGCDKREEGSRLKNLNQIQDLKTKQYAIAGRDLYLVHCANCHQADGTGLGLVIPPLNGADYLLEDPDRTIRIIRYGIKGEITVNGQVYNQPMPANPTLKPIDIAQIATYILTMWGDEEMLITTERVKDVLAR